CDFGRNRRRVVANTERLCFLVCLLVRESRHESGWSSAYATQSNLNFLLTHMSWWTRQQLKFKNPQTRRQAVEKLAAEGTGDAIDNLVDALQDDDAAVRLVVVQALGKLKEPRTLPPLVQSMRDPDGEIREAVVAALMQVGDATCVDVLVGALKDLNLAVRRRAAKALDFFGWQPANDIQKSLR